MKKLGYLFSLFVVVLMFAGCQPKVSYTNFCTHCGAGYMSQDEADHCSVAVGCPYGYKSIPVEYHDEHDNLLPETPELRKAMENHYENGLVCYSGEIWLPVENVELTKEGYIKIYDTSAKVYTFEEILRFIVAGPQCYCITAEHTSWENTYYSYIEITSSSN